MEPLLSSRYLNRFFASMEFPLQWRNEQAGFNVDCWINPRQPTTWVLSLINWLMSKWACLVEIITFSVLHRHYRLCHWKAQRIWTSLKISIEYSAVNYHIWYIHIWEDIFLCRNQWGRKCYREMVTREVFLVPIDVRSKNWEAHANILRLSGDTGAAGEPPRIDTRTRTM